jgi:hypothetical protein
VPLEVVELDGRGHARNTQDPLRVRQQVRLVGQPLQIAAQRAVVSDVESDQRREPAEIRLGQALSDQETTRGEARFQTIERGEQVVYRSIVRLLA